MTFPDFSKLKKSNIRRGISIPRSTEFDDNDRFVLKKCTLYLQRHLDKFGLNDRETFEFISWVLGEHRTEFMKSILSIIKKTDRREFEKKMFDSAMDHYDFSTIILAALSELNSQAHKKIIHQLYQILEKRNSNSGFHGASEIEKTGENLQRLFNLSELEIELCFFLFVIDSFDSPESFFSSHLKAEKFMGRKYLCNALGITINKLNEIFAASLYKSGIIEVGKYDVCLSDEFIHLFQNPAAQSLSDKFYRKTPNDSVPLDHHFIPADQTTHLLRLMHSKPESSTHILLFGEPGTGKTSYAYGLMKELAVPSYEVAQNSENKSHHRRAAITAALNMTNTGPGSILIVDEADNVLNTQNSWFERGETQDKGFLNQMMEEPGARIVWICNSIQNIDPSLLRRFAFSIKFKPFTRKQRISLFENIIKKNRVKRYFSFADIEELARKYNLNAGTMDLAIKKATESGLKTKAAFIKAVSLGLEAYRVMVQNPAVPQKTNTIEHRYSLEGLNINRDFHADMRMIEKFSDHLRNSEDHRIRNMNLLFYGPPGTGKSELARYIAYRLDREIICKRLSDILSPYVGMTEKNIRNAFDEAEREEAVLVIDEADSLLFSREKTMRPYESSQTNEFLTAMEQHKGFLICTTNMIKRIDNASIRRFNFKIKFDYLQPEGIIVFYQKILLPLLMQPIDNNTILSLQKFKNLTPGDFKTVRDRFAFSPRKELNHELFLNALYEEGEIKEGNSTEKKIGFI